MGSGTLWEVDRCGEWYEVTRYGEWLVVVENAAIVVAGGGGDGSRPLWLGGKVPSPRRLLSKSRLPSWRPLRVGSSDDDRMKEGEGGGGIVR